MKKSINLELSAAEKALLRTKKITQKSLAACTADELIFILDAPAARAKELRALCEFQRVPSIGIRFAKDLMQMGYFSLAAIKNKSGHDLLNEYEQLMGHWIDPCVEDQFLLAVHHANNPGSTKQWWDFTAERKAFRAQYGHPALRPAKPWYENAKGAAFFKAQEAKTGK